MESQQPEEIRKALALSDRFHGMLHEELEQVQQHLDTIMHTAETDLQAALVSDDYAEMQRVVKSYQDCGDEVRPPSTSCATARRVRSGDAKCTAAGAGALAAGVN